MAQKQLVIPPYITVRDLATAMEASPIGIIKELMKVGIMATINQEIDFDTASIVTEEMGFEAIAEAVESDEVSLEDLPEWRSVIAQEKSANLKRRPPVVTIMGHVDHGKTSLLDVIRKANVADGESGGITQHIGAYQVRHDNQVITFLDTPGHAAFTSMRARGAQVTDIAVLVVAADDGLMPQTKEAIDHALAAHVPIVVAMNKMDLVSANPAKVMQQLNDYGLVPDEWGGDTLVIPVSAKKGDGIADLLEAVILTADDIEPVANPKAKETTGVVIEAKMERGRGVVATVLVQNGTLKRGDTLIIGTNYGKIKAMEGYDGKAKKTALPSTPVSVSGLNSMPSAGDTFEVIGSEKIARKVAAKRQAAMPVTSTGPSLEEFFNQLQSGSTKSLTLIVKADVQGSLEPILTSLEEMSTQEVKVNILRSSTGNVTESDVMLASASGAIILGFNIGVDSAAKKISTSEDIEIQLYDIIYKLFEDVENALKGMHDPVYEMKLIGRAEIRQVFRIKSVGNVAGGFMRTGQAKKDCYARVIRNGKLIHEGPVSSLKHLQDNVNEIRKGFEFGLSVKGWDRFRENDIVEFFIQERVG